MDDDVKQFLKQELENGTYFLNHLEISKKLREIFAQRKKIKGWDSELDDLSFELMAGLAVYHTHLYGRELEILVQDPHFSKESKIKALHLLRHHILDPDHAASSLQLFQYFLDSTHLPLADFSARSFLQVLTEMRVGGQIDGTLAHDKNRREMVRILKRLSGEGWMEADELLDFLEL